jgi:hypothetical protein
MKPIKLTELHIREGAKRKLPFGGWAKYTTIELNGIELGFMKDFWDYENKLTVKTYAAEQSVDSYDLKWLLEKNGYKLTS